MGDSSSSNKMVRLQSTRAVMVLARRQWSSSQSMRAPAEVCASCSGSEPQMPCVW